MDLLKDKCIFKSIKELSEDFYLSNQIVDTSIYSYKIGSDSIKEKNTNVTFFDFSNEDIEFIMNYFGLDKEKDNVYIILADMPSSNPKSATSDYEYVLVLENGTELRLSDIKEDFYVDVSVPIRDLDLANFDSAKAFGEQGFDIYDINSSLYNDFCTPAYSGDNDMVLSDRKKYIYPNNVTLCKSNCVYKSVDIETQRIICECNLNGNNNYTEDINDFSNEKEDNGNIITYFLDKVNYKLFKCFDLLFYFNNFNSLLAFYIISAVFVLIISLSFSFLVCGLQNIRVQMYKELPTQEKVREMLIEELKKIKKQKNTDKANPLNKKNKAKNIKTNSSVQSSKNMKAPKLGKNISKLTNKNNVSNSSNNLTKYKNKQKYKNIKINFHQNSFFVTQNYINSKNNLTKKEIINHNISNKLNKSMIKIIESESEEELKKENPEELNDLPFSQALNEDKRNIFRVYMSVAFQKFELINIFTSGERVRIICICEYILSLLFDFFFNALLYSDAVVSQKYHNNGELDFMASLMLSLVSNIISAIVCNIIRYSTGVEERLDQIGEIRREYKYLFALNKFLKFLKIKMIFFILTEIILVGGCFIYIIIFCIIYNKSQTSLLTNYLYSLLEGLIKSLIVTTVIVICRKGGIAFRSSYLYNTSKYLNENL